MNQKSAQANVSISDESSTDLARKLRQRRKQLGLTMKEVADAANLSVGFISQIERSITMPSISSLIEVCKVLNADVGEFLDQPKIVESFTKSSERTSYALGAGSLNYERVSDAFPSSILRSVVIHMPAGHKGEAVSHDGEELLFIINGSITLELDGNVSILTKGDTAHYSSKRKHSTWNHTNEPAAVLWVGTMNIFGEDTIKKDQI